jgi:FKBP-type peptidyl-prolyl cis-trans isomerase FkpA
MKQLAFAFLSVLVLATFSCKKEYDPIKTVDNNNIQSYISANGLKMNPGDSGIYYQVIKPGDTGNPIVDSDVIFYSFTLKTLDGKTVSTDTVLNRINSFAGFNQASYPFYNTTTGLITSGTFSLPPGLQFGIKKYLQKRNGIIRLLIPSNQAYGAAGLPSSPDGRIKVSGNESLDITVNLYGVNSQLAYDTVQIRNYIRKNNLTGFRKTLSGLYYKIVDPGSGKDQIYSTSTVTVNYTKRLLLNQATIESKSLDAALLANYIGGWQEGLQFLNSGGKIRLLIPSGMAYGAEPLSTTVDTRTYNVPPNSILDFDVNVTAVTN